MLLWTLTKSSSITSIDLVRIKTSGSYLGHRLNACPGRCARRHCPWLPCRMGGLSGTSSSARSPSNPGTDRFAVWDSPPWRCFQDFSVGDRIPFGRGGPGYPSRVGVPVRYRPRAPGVVSPFRFCARLAARPAMPVEWCAGRGVHGADPRRKGHGRSVGCRKVPG